MKSRAPGLPPRVCPAIRRGRCAQRPHVCLRIKPRPLGALQLRRVTLAAPAGCSWCQR